MLGLIDNHIDEAAMTAWPKKAGRISHGNQSLWQIKDAYCQFGGNEVSSLGLGLINLKQQQEFLYQILKGIDQLIDQKVMVICLPMAFASSTPLLEEIANACHEKNMLLIAPAGNKGQERIMYPGAYPHVLCVGAMDISGDVASYSGSLQDEQGHYIKPDILAKGSLMIQDDHISEGTSVACAEVAGLAASILEINPDLTAFDLKRRILNHCSPHTGSRFGFLDGKKSEESDQHFRSDHSYNQPHRSGFSAGWVDPVLTGEYKRANQLGRSLKALVSLISLKITPTDLSVFDDPLVSTYEKFNHLNVVCIDARPAFFEVLFAHPDLAWASSLDLNYFDI
ncbi:S8 family peptidase [Roseivirga pacifica]|uniref:S8 family peptidase n=1 Tax=Roseivirga pacifica TaxID=1267423 RepID=UPI0020944BB2|nr:S8/S53 family peptidase [Roseivirga pacifica]MCO6358755.1 S8 family serine peptidase [Roseivirga pacifica]MCO6365609.1 S8 family serine peptidase [Roseivirga pacifica]MCO6371661.1 S8 family serine peptidase [Roseivirga pacifica]MCO6376228.1 S8 family serine peptidase [Roseivirga pacifica]MCO6379039.1 S8 family serine peptidase [Roseivirga pacifica]